MNEDKITYIFQLGELFERVQLESVFPDSKTFVDCIPRVPLQEILEKYQSEKDEGGFSLSVFVHRYFENPPHADTSFHTNQREGIKEHISALWDVLTKESENSGSLIGLPKPYIVPGGRFRELFYWDSYFTMLGLQIDRRMNLVENMIDNFCWLIDRYGYIPNGNRTYFLGRSQPPFLALMVALLAEVKGPDVYEKYIGYLLKEHAFWMRGVDDTGADRSRAIRIDDQVVMNRYWDNSDTARPEAYKKDVTWAKGLRDKAVFFRHERAACESGWDFSSRWMADRADIKTMVTTDILPIDLNCLLWYLEKTIADHSANEPKVSSLFRERHLRRGEAINSIFWKNTPGFYFDYNFRRQLPSDNWNLAAVFPLFFELSSPEQAAKVAGVLKNQFLKAGGFTTTLSNTGQQWDAPNGWAPLQWMAIKGLVNYGFTDLALEAAGRWMQGNEIIFEKTGKLKEKYNVEAKDAAAEPGTYPTQDGFGWTNGVYLALDALMKKLRTEGG